MRGAVTVAAITAVVAMGCGSGRQGLTADHETALGDANRASTILSLQASTGASADGDLEDEIRGDMDQVIDALREAPCAELDNGEGETVRDTAKDIEQSLRETALTIEAEQLRDEISEAQTCR